MPTARNGRNLLDIADKLLKNERLGKHLSMRNTEFHTEIATEDRIYRMNTLSGKGQVHNGIQPSCMFPNERRDNITIDQSKKLASIQKLFEYINSHNRLFNYKFRDISCVLKGRCKFPTNIAKSFREPLEW